MKTYEDAVTDAKRMLDDEQVHEAVAWALAAHRLERGEGEIFPEELSKQDWLRARVALDAAHRELVGRLPLDGVESP